MIRREEQPHIRMRGFDGPLDFWPAFAKQAFYGFNIRRTVRKDNDPIVSGDCFEINDEDWHAV
jgi:hypothetical protein